MTPDGIPDDHLRLLAQGGVLRMQVEGDSMAPTIRPGDVVVAEPLGGPAPEPGDIVLVRGARGAPAVHRVIARRQKAGEWLIVTGGDATGGLDPVLRTWAVLGKVTSMERDGGAVALPAARPPLVRRLRAALKLRLRCP